MEEKANTFLHHSFARNIQVVVAEDILGVVEEDTLDLSEDPDY